MVFHKVFFFTWFCLVLWPSSISAQTDIKDQALNRAQNYLSSLKTLKADFSQIAPNGNQATGIFYLQRPGKLRFEYDAPIQDFIVADGTFIFYYDAELKQQTNTLIGQTPAHFILQENLDLKEDIIVENVISKDGLLFISLRQREDPLAGRIHMGFSPDPFQLVRWDIETADGSITRVDLKNIEQNIDLSRIKFYYIDPDFGKTPTYNE